ncbi:hypothetical protein EPI10_016959 [Gossypium australe]|uniref:Uncharacterized protein n=1 Tax=Gossypium australe TaxID=47621 RepID=A0A5B6VQ36_9ROSI|nr:hypothetical protein EPI10_016959 [Gossypium australe]
MIFLLLPPACFVYPLNPIFPKKQTVEALKNENLLSPFPLPHITLVEFQSGSLNLSGEHLPSSGSEAVCSSFPTR